ncbi:S8 family serine peptidase [Deinococcus marmoris]|uniref:S8 family serine peptidase n=1 Tax=Deinococcus marmoris TaxID=249408 RepID=UPI000B2DF96B|nr:S8 family serine peptidase [Deinococcus marmoris]
MRKSRFRRFITCVGISSVVSGLSSGLEAPQPSEGAALPPKLTLVNPYQPPADGKQANVTGKGNFIPTTNSKYCPVTAFEAPGQAWSAGLTSGGATFQASTRYPNKTVEPKFSEIRLNASNQISGRTAIIVVDHFAPLQLKIDEDGPGGNPPIKNFYLSHGNLVVAHIRSLLTTSGYGNYKSSPLTLRRGSHYIEIYPLEIGDPKQPLDNAEKYGTTALIRQLKNLVNNEIAKNSTHILINMSFALLPCDILINYREVRKFWYNSSKLYTMNQYITDLQKLNLGMSVENVLKNVPDTEPFRVWYNENIPKLRKEKKVTLTASSSNFGLNFSTAPASWNDIISVGAVDKNWNQVYDSVPGSSKKYYWSSRSDIQTVGEWFKFLNDQNKNQIKDFCNYGGTCIADDIKPNSIPSRYANFAYRGTSFSAPSVTAFLATFGDSECFNDASPQGFKPLPPQSKGKEFKFYGTWVQQSCKSDTTLIKPSPKTP